MKFSSVILAAGEGKRIKTPKAILMIKERCLADIQFELIFSCGIEQIKIVIGAESEKVLSLLKHKNHTVINEDYMLGQFSSLLKGINSVSNYNGLLVLPVDVYPIDREVIKVLMSEFEEKYDAVVPVFDGKRGHPVILSYKLSSSLVNFDIQSSRLDLILRESNLKEVSVSSKTILNNINNLSDLSISSI